VRILAVVALALAAAAPSFGLPSRPRVWLVQQTPPTVGGVSFHPRERVRVRFSTVGEVWAKTLVASARGGFAVRFPQAHLDRCVTWFIRAEGNAGSRVTVRHIPECAPA
jgi:hypothetical protein